MTALHAAEQDTGTRVPVVLLCDAQPLRRRLVLRQLATSVPRVHVVESGTATELLSCWHQHRPELAFVSSDVHDAAHTVSSLTMQDLSAWITLISEPRKPVAPHEAALSGAQGFLSWADGEDAVAGMVALMVESNLTPDIPAQRNAEDTTVLSLREKQVLVGMSRGMSNNEIARRLYLSEDTVKTHARRLYRKLHVKDRAAAVAVGLRRGLIM